MRVTFLGTGGSVPTTVRNPSGLMVAREGDLLLFDCGEGTQRQMMRYRTGFDIDHVFLTHMHGDHVLGLPGLLQTLEFNGRSAPLSLHAPAGTKSVVETLVGVTGDRPDFPLRINQVDAGEVALDAAAYDVRAVRADHRTTAVGYALVEGNRKGVFDREKAEEDLGIPPGPKYSRLHRGEPVEHDGRTIQPDEVVGPPRPGRRVVYSGDTRPTDAVEHAAQDADLLVHDGTFATDRGDRARYTGHSTAREAAEVANRAGARRLAITHVSSRYAGDPTPLSAELDRTFRGETAFVAADGQVAEIPYPDSDQPFELSEAG